MAFKSPIKQLLTNPMPLNPYPEIEAQFQIRILTGTLSGKIFPISQTRIIIGRSSRDCDLNLEGELYCARKHCAIEWSDLPMNLF